MKILSLARSAEACQQADWQAFDVFFSSAVSRDDILSWGSLGQLIYLQQLREPFFRIASSEFLIKGFEGRDNLRIAFVRGFLPPFDQNALSEFLFF